MPVQGQGYLATFTFQPSEGATGAFCIAVKDSHDSSFLNDSGGALLASDPGEIEVIDVSTDCLSDEHCEQVACRTCTCVNYECVYDNAPQGTPCDDGLYCTVTDECDGNGACAGSATPCPSKFPKRCETPATCIGAICMCSAY